MANDNETVEQVYEEMKEVTGTRRFIDSHYCNHCGDQIDGEGSALDVYADRILAAHKLEMADEKRISDAVIQSLRDKKLEMAGEIVQKNAEIVRLRELVSELLNKLVINHCIGCQVDDCDRCVYYEQNEALVAKAREVVKAEGGER